MGNTTNARGIVSFAGIKGLLNRTYKSGFLRNVAVVASGTAGAQAIVIAFSPIITRLYGPEAFGILGIFMAIVAVVTPIAALSYPIAIVLPKEDSDARGIARLSAYIALGVAALTALLLLTAGDKIVNLLQVQEVSSYIWLLPLVILFSAWLQINQQWVIRRKHFKLMARATVLHAFLVNGAKAGIGLFKPLAAVLIVLYALGQALHAALLSLGAKRADGCAPQAHKKDHQTPLWDLARRHYDFPCYRAPQRIVYAVSERLPVLMFAAFLGPAYAGFYVLCIRFLKLPGELIGKSVHDVFYPKITEAAHAGKNLTNLILKATLGLAAIGAFPFSLIAIFGPWLFGFIFGQEWVVAGEYARWLSVWVFVQFITRASSASVPVLGLQKVHLIYEIIRVLLLVIALLAGLYIYENDVYAVILFSFAGATKNIVLFITIYLVSKSFKYQES